MRLSVVTAVCCVLELCVLVEGDYQVEVRLLGYDNPTQICQECPLRNGFRSCCDDDNRNDRCDGNRRCDSYFTYCLRLFDSQDSQKGGCSDPNERMRSSTNWNDGSIVFTQDMVLGLNNPFYLQGFSNDYTGVQLYIDVRDQDSGPDDLIDIFLIDYNQTVGMPQRQTYSGIHGFVTMDLNITVFCVGNFAEPDCSSQCVTGFTGPDCQTVDNCVGVNCSGNGLCVNGMDSFMCNCSAGYNGSECEMNIDDCLSNPCASTGQCVDGVDSFTCSCDQGYTGQLCETDIDECEGVDCSGNGECLDEVDSFSCVCSPGYTGNLCDVDIQEPSQSGSRVGSVVGGVFGAIIGLILIIVIVVVVVLLVLRWRNSSGWMKFRGNNKNNGHNSAGFVPGDNPVYEIRNTSNDSRGQDQTISPVHYVKSTPDNRQRTDSNLQERELENPIYGEAEESGENMYEAPFESQEQNEAVQDHEFDNPIYGNDADTEENTYSVPCDSHIPH